MFWNSKESRQRLLLYLAALWFLAMASILGDVLGTRPPAPLAGWFSIPLWDCIIKALVCLVLAMVAAELVLRLVLRVRAANERAAMQQSVFENFTALNPFAVLTFDNAGKLLASNQAAAKLFGAPLPDGYSLICDEVFQQANLLARIKRVFAGHVVHLGDVQYDTRQLQHVHLPPRQIMFRATFFPVLDNEGVVNSVVGIYEDITERVKLESHLTRAQRMESIGTLAGGIAHDFNNILGGTLGNLSLLKAKLEPQSPLHRYVATMETSLRRASQLTRQLLTFVRGEISQLKPTRLNDCIENVARLIESSFDKKYRIVRQLEPQLMTVECDGGQIEQALLNLCLNARDAMPDGGTITIASRNVFVRDDSRGGQIPAEIGRGAYAVVSVTDTGCGMDEETQRRIFEPFFTTKAPGKGTGLGLAMVFGIVKNHGGHIDLHSQVGKGTTFDIYLKANLKTAVEEAPKERQPVSGGQETILLVDDEEVIRDFAAEALREKGYRVLTAEDGQKAIDMFRTEGREIHLVVTDMVMPNAGGRQVFSMVKSLRPDVRFIFSSGYTDSDVLQDAVKRGQVHFIQKPYTAEELCALIRQVLDAPRQPALPAAHPSRRLEKAVSA